MAADDSRKPGGSTEARKRAHIETVVTFEDGRKGVLKADLAVSDAASAQPATEPLRKAS